METNNPYAPPLSVEPRRIRVPTETSKAADLAVSSFGAAIVALCLLCMFPPASLVLAIIAIHYGRASLKRFYSGDDRLGGKDIATAGIAIGSFLVISFALMLLALLVASCSAAWS